MTDLVLERAEAGDAEAQYLLAKRLQSEQTAETLKQALAWFEKAAAQRHALAAYELGLAWDPVGLAKSYGMPGDRLAAHAWQLKAAELGHRPSMWLVANDWQVGFTGGPPQDRALALQWYLKLVDGDDDSAVDAMVGIAGIAAAQKQWEVAASWYEGAAERGDTYAAGRLRDLEKRGLYRADLERTLALLERGAAAGDPDSLRELASWYEQGRGVARDPIAAYARYSIALIDERAKGRKTDVARALKRLKKKLTAEERARADALARSLLAAMPQD